MANGDQVNEVEHVENGAYASIRPGAGVYWIIHNIYWDGQVTLEKYDGSLSCIFTTDSAAGAERGCNYHVSNDHYIRVKNTHASNHIQVSYDGKDETPV
jgi:hypothetical protein